MSMMSRERNESDDQRLNGLMSFALDKRKREIEAAKQKQQDRMARREATKRFLRNLKGRMG